MDGHGDMKPKFKNERLFIFSVLGTNTNKMTSDIEVIVVFHFHSPEFISLNIKVEL